MWLKNSRPAFVLADSLVALFIVVIATTWFLLVESQLVIEHRHSVERLQAARLAKELADAAQQHSFQHSMSRDGLVARLSGNSVLVYQGQRLILEVNG